MILARRIQKFLASRLCSFFMKSTRKNLHSVYLIYLLDCLIEFSFILGINMRKTSLALALSFACLPCVFLVFAGARKS
jgi:hypothetical protein